MKKLHKLTLGAAFTLLALSACDNEALLPDAPQMNDPDNPNACLLVGDDFHWEGNESRTALTIEDNVAKFSWTTGDKVGILPDEGAQVYFTIPEAEELAEGDELTDEQRRKASFDGGAWALKAESNYAAYYPFIEDFYLDRTKVPVKYTGQKQTGNNNAAHLGAYDYMGARPVTTNSNGGGVTFDFDHVGALVLLKFTVPEAGTVLKSVTLSTDEVTFTAQGTYDLTATKEAGFIITPAEGGTSETMTIDIEHTTTQANEEVTVYFMCAPVDLSGKKVNINIAYGEEEETFEFEADGKNLQAAGGYLMEAKFPVIDLSEYEDGATVDITENSRIIGNGNEYNLTLNVATDATLIFDAGTSGVKLTDPITVADGKTLTLLVAGDAEHTVNGGISLGNGSNVIIEGDLTQANNKLTVTATGSNAGIGANNGVTAGDITIRNARVEATGSGSASSPKVAGAGIGTAKASMKNILIVNSIVTAVGGYYSEYEAHGAAIGMGSDGGTMRNITLIDSEITASHSGEGHASIIGAGPDFAEGDRDGSDIGTMGDIIITNTDLHLSMAESTTDEYAAMIGTADFSGGALSYSVNMGKIIFADITQAELDEMIATWSIPSDFAEYGGYVLGLGYWTHVYKYNTYEGHCVGTFGGVWVSDGNDDIVQIGDADGYINPE